MNTEGFSKMFSCTDAAGKFSGKAAAKATAHGVAVLGAGTAVVGTGQAILSKSPNNGVTTAVVGGGVGLLALAAAHPSAAAGHILASC